MSCRVKRGWGIVDKRQQPVRKGGPDALLFSDERALHSSKKYYSYFGFLFFVTSNDK